MTLDTIREQLEAIASPEWDSRDWARGMARFALEALKRMPEPEPTDPGMHFFHDRNDDAMDALIECARHGPVTIQILVDDQVGGGHIHGKVVHGGKWSAAKHSFTAGGPGTERYSRFNMADLLIHLRRGMQAFKVRKVKP